MPAYNSLEGGSATRPPPEHPFPEANEAVVIPRQDAPDCLNQCRVLGRERSKIFFPHFMACFV
jgi:hypothetical protein